MTQKRVPHFDRKILTVVDSFLLIKTIFSFVVIWSICNKNSCIFWRDYMSWDLILAGNKSIWYFRFWKLKIFGEKIEWYLCSNNWSKWWCYSWIWISFWYSFWWIWISFCYWIFFFGGFESLFWQSLWSSWIWYFFFFWCEMLLRLLIDADCEDFIWSCFKSFFFVFLESE